MRHKLRFTAEKIAKRVQLAKAHILTDTQAINPFRLRLLENADDVPDLCPAGAAGDERVEWDSYWAGADTHFLLTSEFSIPDDWKPPFGLHLPLGEAGDIFSHPETLVYIDGKMFGSADRYHQLIELGAEFADGKTHRLQLYGWTGMTGWPPDPTDPSKLFMRTCGVTKFNPTLRDFVSLADVALDVVDKLDDCRSERHLLLNALDDAFQALVMCDPIGEEFHASVSSALQILEKGISAAGTSEDVTLHAIGHAHMDIAYLWPVRESRHKNARTYLNVLRLMDDHPDFLFSHSQPQLYKYTEQDYPEIFDKICSRVEDGRWEPMGGMWVEPDLSVPGGESLVRQILLGRQYFQEKFGAKETPVLWLPDTFGFPGSIPQLMKLAGLRGFVSNKMSWNQYNRMPYSTFVWRGIDGSEVLTQFLTTPRTVQHLPFPTNYKSDLSAAEVFGTWENSSVKETVTELPICFGYGDGGGGPNDSLVRRMSAWSKMPAAPQVKASNVGKFFDTLEPKRDELARWDGELYLEGHRGTLTSQGWIKKANRDAESEFHTSEFLQVLSGSTDVQMREAWELLCLNQFHDILTGTSITKVFDDARLDHARIAETNRRAQDAAIARMRTDSGSERPAILSTMPFKARRIAEIQNATTAKLPEGVRTQQLSDGYLIDFDEVEPYSITNCPDSSGPLNDGANATRDAENNYVMHNGLIRATFNPSGELISIYDLQAEREVLSPGAFGNQLIAFEDRPVSWDAWDIDIFIDENFERLGPVASIEIVEQGPLRASLRLRWTYRESAIEQTVQLRVGSKRLDFRTQADWHQTHVLLKVAFPVDIRSHRATYDIQFGVVERPTHQNTSWDFARFEVAGQKWADLSEGNYGVALLNDCKYGYDIKDQTMRLSLIKSATMPDPIADQGLHEFTYSLLPHTGDWRNGVVPEAYELNNPARVLFDTKTTGGQSFVAVDNENIVIETIKPAEDGNGFIVRMFEAHGNRGQCKLRFLNPVEKTAICDLLENEIAPLAVHDQEIQIAYKPFEIISIRCTA